MMSLRAFEATARHLSFTRAAIELHLTQTAISHQIKNLEDLLQVKLFVRNANMIALTEAGEAYLRSVRAAIMEISTATDRATDQSDENMLTVQCLGLFAIKRLLPHLHDFRAQHPAISLKLRTIQSFENKFHHDFDVAIWHGSGDWAGMTTEKLADEEVFPVCSARLLADGAVLKSPDDLDHHTIIRTSSVILRDEWPFWLETAKTSEMKFRSEITCDYMITSLQAGDRRPRYHARSLRRCGARSCRRTPDRAVLNSRAVNVQLSRGLAGAFVRPAQSSGIQELAGQTRR